MDVYKIIFDSGNFSEFIEDFKLELEKIIPQLNECMHIFKTKYLPINHQDINFSETQYIFLTLESCITSVRLLAEGHINASGNTMRISYEALCTAMLLNCKSKLKGNSKKKPLIDFRHEFQFNHPDTKPHKVIDLVINNSDLLLKEGKEWFSAAKKFYNGYSHATNIAMFSTALPSGGVIIGGKYIHELKDITAIHLEFIRRYACQLPGILTEIKSNPHV